MLKTKFNHSIKFISSVRRFKRSFKYNFSLVDIFQIIDYFLTHYSVTRIICQHIEYNNEDKIDLTLKCYK